NHHCRVACLSCSQDRASPVSHSSYRSHVWFLFFPSSQNHSSALRSRYVLSRTAAPPLFPSLRRQCFRPGIPASDNYRSCSCSVLSAHRQLFHQGPPQNDSHISHRVLFGGLPQDSCRHGTASCL